MLSIRLDPDVERRLAELAQRTGRTKSYYARELIEGNLEDLEDRYLAEARLEKRRPALTSRQVRKELGLDAGVQLPPESSDRIDGGDSIRNGITHKRESGRYHRVR
jgi:RHH-type rel operon transcriptional repressor/antitoxin RelB